MRTVAVMLWLGAACLLPAVARAAIHVRMQPDSVTVQPGDTVTVILTVFQADSPFNGFDAFVAFDSTRFQLVSTPLGAQVGAVMSGACGNLFHQFVPHSDNAEIHLGFLCPGVFVTGPGEIYKVRLRVLAVDGPATLAWGPATEFYHAGFFVRPVESYPMTVIVQHVTGVGDPPAKTTGQSLETPRPNPYRGDGPMTLKFSLTAPSRVDFTIFDVQGRQVASRASEGYDAGAHSVAWTGLRLAPGRYLVEMNSGSESQTARPWVVIR